MVFQESEKIELKVVVTDDIKKEVIAFANCDGGKLYIGVCDDGTVIGVENPDETALQISNMVRDAIKPDVTMFLYYQTLEIEGKYIVAVDIQRGTNRPYYIAKKGLRPEGVYVRQGYSSVSAADAAIRYMIKETDGDSFEKMRSLEQNLTFESAKKEFLERNISFEPVQMKTLELMSSDGIYTNLGLLLSDQCVHTIKAVVFEGSNQNVFKDRKEFSGSLLKQMEEVYDYIDFYNQTHSFFEKLRRIDDRDYPEAAVREALLNSLVHREYSYSASTLISIYADRIEFTSIGGLVNGITLQDVMMGISVCRNTKLANIFYRLALIEAYGTGIKKIMDAYSESGFTPKIELSDHVFKMILPNRHVEKVDLSKQKTAENHYKERIDRLIQKNGSVTRRELESVLNISQTTCGRILNQMVKSGYLLREGNGKNTHYILP